MLVDDESGLLRPAAASRRVEKDFLPEKFAERFPARPFDEIGNEARVRRRGPVHKGVLPAWVKTRWGRFAFAALTLGALAGVVVAALAVRSYFEHDARFRIDSSNSIQTMGNSQLTRNDLLSVFGADIGRNIFYVPLAERRADLEGIPWVEHATVMRILPDELRVAVRERTPVAFVRVGDRIKLVDGAGVILDMPPTMMAARKFSFPVVTGISAADPLTTRAARMELYQKFMHALGDGGGPFLAQVSEVDLSDPEDLRVTLPVKSSDLLLHFGDKDFLARYRIYESHLSEWEQQYPNLAAVDLRYENEVVLKMAQNSDQRSAISGQEQQSVNSDQHSGTQGSGVRAQGSAAAKKAVVAKKKVVAGTRAHSVKGHTTRHARKRR
ncbi:MAG: FtsQ-type POTRA domain-containing protein [Acidobacteriaceae bacterium]